MLELNIADVKSYIIHTALKALHFVDTKSK